MVPFPGEPELEVEAKTFPTLAPAVRNMIDQRIKIVLRVMFA